MTEKSTDPGFLLEITVNPELEEELVDCLLSYDHKKGFSSFPINGHSSEHDHLSLAEQVSGRKRKIRFQIHLDEDDLYRVLNQLRQAFKGRELYYQVLPVVESGYM